MLFRNQAMKYGYMDEAGEGAGGSAGGEAAGDAGDAGAAAGAPDVAALQAQLQQYEQRVAAMDKKNQELLDEKRREKQAREQAEREKAEKAGDFKQLFESSEKERETLRAELENLRNGISRERINGEAMKLAASLAEGPNAEILSEFIARRLKYSDGAIKVTDENGNLTVSSLDDLKAEFSGSARFASLIKGRQASGGSASGGSGSGSAAKEITREEFDRLGQNERMEKVRSGFKVVG